MLSDELLAPLMLAVEQRFGLVSRPLTETLRTALLEEARRLGSQPSQYAARLVASAGDSKELAGLIGRLLLGHTHFYRHARVWEWLVPNLRRVAERAPVRALIAGCSTGEEAYTLASLLAANYGINGFDVVAVDVNAKALQLARHGTYLARDASKLPDPWRQRYLEENDDGTVRFHAALRSRVRFVWCNLTEGPPEGPYHLIMIRNVLTYMTPVATAKVLERLVKAMAKPGLLAVAPHETFLVSEYTSLAPAVDVLPVFGNDGLPQAVRQTEQQRAALASSASRADLQASLPEGPVDPHLPVAEGADCVAPDCLADHEFVLRPTAQVLHRRSAAWDELSAQLRGLLTVRPPEVSLDLSAVLRMDNQVKLSIRAALRLLGAAGVQVNLLPGAALRQERV